MDLSTDEAQPTLDAWEERYAALKQELSVRSVAKSISSVAAPYTIRVLAIRNGAVEKHQRRGELIVGSSVAGVRGILNMML